MKLYKVSVAVLIVVGFIGLSTVRGEPEIKTTNSISSPIATSQITSVPLTKEYRKRCLEWASKYLYKGKSESAVYTDVKKRHMHYAYTGFLEMFPKTAHKAEIEKLMQGFLLFSSPNDKNPIFSYTTLKEELNYNGVDSAYRWNDAFSGFFGKDNSYTLIANNVDSPERGVPFKKKLGLDYVGPVLCIGNLQLLVGTFTPMKNEQIELAAKVIFPKKTGQ